MGDVNVKLRGELAAVERERALGGERITMYQSEIASLVDDFKQERALGSERITMYQSEIANLVDDFHQERSLREVSMRRVETLERQLKETRFKLESREGYDMLVSSLERRLKETQSELDDMKAEQMRQCDNRRYKAIHRQRSVCQDLLSTTPDHAAENDFSRSHDEVDGQ